MKGSIYLRAIMAVFVIAVLSLSCGRSIKSPTSPPNSDRIPATPVNLTASIGDGVVELSWAVPDTAGIAKYRIYMSDSVDTHYALLSEVATQTCRATGCRNGINHYFQVSAVSRDGFEGHRSEAVNVIPNLYGLLINNGDNYTGNRQVGLGFLAPAGTAFMEISNDPNFAGSQWETYAPTKIWQMTFNDGMKIIYGKFRDSSGHITIDAYADSITLDTRAFIDSVTFSPLGGPFIAGNQIHFKLYAGEPEGQAFVTLGQGLAQLALYDDGNRGDAVSGDGIYELNYVVPNNLDFENAPIYGNLNDRVGNSAIQIQASHNMSIRRAPDPVSIFSINAPNRYFDRLELNWSAATANDFAFYAIYRSSSAGVDSTRTLVMALYSVNSTSYTDTLLNQRTRYYYKVYVVDNTGLWGGSNEASAMTNQNMAPDPAVLFPVVTVPGTHDRLQITWSDDPMDPDFSHYELYRSTDSTVNQFDRLVMASTNMTCIDSSLGADSTYYYRVQSVDRAGNSSWSNIESGRTGHALLETRPDIDVTKIRDGRF